MSVLVTLELPTKPGAVDDFLAALKVALVDTRAYAGCLSVETYVDRENENILLVEQWETAEHQQAYMAWRVETGLMDAIGGFLSGAPLARTLDPYADV